MAFINEIRLSGRAVADAERKGKGPVRFALMQGGGKKKDSNERWPTEFFPVSVWPQDAPAAAAVKKGDVVRVAGRLRQYELKNDAGAKRYYELLGKTVEIAQPQPKPLMPRSYSSAAKDLEITDADIPF